jgi:hypothetical protein
MLRKIRTQISSQVFTIYVASDWDSCDSARNVGTHVVGANDGYLTNCTDTADEDLISLNPGSRIT